MEYRNKNAKIEKLKIYKYSSVGDLYNNFKLGNIDLINTSNTNIQEYVGTIGINLKEYQGREYIYLALNCDNKILANKEVRQAMSYFIDKDTLVSKVLNNKYNVSDFILDYGSYLYKEEKEIVTMQKSKRNTRSNRVEIKLWQMAKRW